MSGLAMAPIPVPVPVPVPVPAACDLLDARDFPDRNALIGFLVVHCGWSTAKVGELFERSDRQIRRIAREEQATQRLATRHQPEPLTKGETAMMLRDLSVDPYTSVEERDAARDWLERSADCRGIEDFPGYPSVGTAAQA